MNFRKLFGNTSPVASAAVLTPPPSAHAPVPVAAPPETAPVDLAPALKQAQDSLKLAQEAHDAAKAEIVTRDADIARLNDELKTAREQFDALKTANDKTREEITQEIRQKEMATIAAAQGIPLSEVPPECHSGKEEKSAPPVDYSKVDPLTLISRGRQAIMEQKSKK